MSMRGYLATCFGLLHWRAPRCRPHTASSDAAPAEVAAIDEKVRHLARLVVDSDHSRRLEGKALAGAWLGLSGDYLLARVSKDAFDCAREAARVAIDCRDAAGIASALLAEAEAIGPYYSHEREGLLQRAIAFYRSVGDVRGEALGKRDLFRCRGLFRPNEGVLREECLPVFERLGEARESAITAREIARASYDWDEKLRILRAECLPAFERLGDVRESAVTLGEIADALWNRGHERDALELYRKQCLPAFERLDDARESAIVLCEIAHILNGSRRFAEAIDVCRDEIVPAFQRLANAGLAKESSRARIFCKIADISVARGDFDEALGIYRKEVLPQARLSGDPGGVLHRANILKSVAELFVKRGDLDEAIIIYRNKLRPGGEARLAELLSERGDWDDALKIYRENVLPAERDFRLREGILYEIDWLEARISARLHEPRCV
jgi:tetratricopeptide (TPR) repeat protein